MNSYWKCPNCGVMNEGNQQACTSCHKPQPVTSSGGYILVNIPNTKPTEQIDQGPPSTNDNCPYCQEPIQSDWFYCRWCGAGLKVNKPASNQTGSTEPSSTEYRPSEYVRDIALKAGVAEILFPK